MACNKHYVASRETCVCFWKRLFFFFCTTAVCGFPRSLVVPLRLCRADPVKDRSTADDETYFGFSTPTTRVHSFRNSLTNKQSDKPTNQPTHHHHHQPTNKELIENDEHDDGKQQALCLQAFNADEETASLLYGGLVDFRHSTSFHTTSRANDQPTTTDPHHNDYANGQWN